MTTTTVTMMTPVETTPTTTERTLTRGAVGGNITHVLHAQSDMLHIHGGRGVVV